MATRPDIVPTPEQILDFKAAHGPDLRAVSFPMGDHTVTTVVRPPSPVEYRCFQDTAREDSQRRDAIEQLARDCLIFPSKEEIAELCKRKPAALGKVGLTAIDLAGNADEVAVKKL